MHFYEIKAPFTHTYSAMQTASLGPNELLRQSQNNDYCFFFSLIRLRLEKREKLNIKNQNTHELLTLVIFCYFDTRQYY